MQTEEKQIVVTSKAYRLKKPREIHKELIEHVLREGHVVVEPTIASICHADLRYYTGQRRPEALARKLPMALIHEGIGKVIKSLSPNVKTGQRVVIVPNLPGYLLRGISREECCPVCKSGKSDNYCHEGKFLGSGVDGIAQNRLVLPAACTIPIPDDVPDDIAVLSELCSVSVHALSQAADHLENARIAVFGDGPVGYLTAAMLHHVFNVPRDRLHVFGAIPEKIEQFHFAITGLVQEYNFSNSQLFDVVVECTGGRFSQSAINQAIEILSPKGHLILMGVTEEQVPINTRDILEKGITLTGSSRSTSFNYTAVLCAMRDLDCQQTLRKLLPDQRIPVHSAEDFVNAMEHAASHKDWKKIVLDFRWEPIEE